MTYYLLLILPEHQDELEVWENQVNAARSDEATHLRGLRLFDDPSIPSGDVNTGTAETQRMGLVGVIRSEPNDDTAIIHMAISDDHFQVVHDDQLPNQVNEEGLGGVEQGELGDQPPQVVSVVKAGKLARQYLKAEGRLAEPVFLKKDLKAQRKANNKIKALQTAVQQTKDDKLTSLQQAKFKKYFSNSAVAERAFGENRAEPDPEDINPKKRPHDTDKDNEEDRNDTTPTPTLPQ